MKKAILMLMIITVMLSIFVCGFLIGRNQSKNLITISPVTTEATNAPDTANVSGKININTATAEELMLLPGVGPTLAQRIIEYRTNVSPFRSISDLTNVEGIGDQKLLQMMVYISI